MKIYFSILSLCLALLSHAQDEDYMWKTERGEPFTTARKSNFSGFIGVNGTTLFSIDYLPINRKKQELFLRRHHRADLKLVDSKNLFRLIDEDYYNEPKEIFYQNDTVYLFSTLNGLKTKFNLIYLEIFNQYGDLLSERIVDTLDLDVEYFIEESIEKDGFLLASHNRYENLLEQHIRLIALDTKGAMEWEQELRSPTASQNITIEQIRYSRKTPVYLLCNYGYERIVGVQTNTDNDLINHKYALWAYDTETTFLKEFELRIKGRWINGISAEFNSNQDLILSGYLNESKRNSMNGIFSLVIHPDLSTGNSNYYTYKKGFYSKFVEEKRVSKTKELDDIVLRNCIVLPDDSYFLIGEHYYQYTERNYDPRTNITTTTENYNYNSIIVSYLDSSGNHIWTDRIPKFQHTVNDIGYYSSFTVMQKEDLIYLFFNDSEKNAELGLTDYFNYRSISNNRRSQISYVCFDPAGILARGALLNEDTDFLLRATQSYQVTEDYFYLYGEFGKSRRIYGVEMK